MRYSNLIPCAVAALLLQCQPPKSPVSISGFSSVSQVDSGRAVGVMMTAYLTTLLADGDQTLFRVTVTDSTGREIKRAENPIQIYIEGDALMVTREGEALVSKTDTSGMEYLEHQLKDGLCHLVFKTGAQTGKIKVEVKSDGLWSASHEIHIIPADVEQLKPGPDQLDPVTKSIDRMIGADISFLPQIEVRGQKFYENGIEKDAIEILRDHGFNYIRLRIFVNPEHEKGYSPERGFCGLEPTLQMARRINDAGMKLLLNFHYSDYWADPQQQNKPAVWEGLDFETLTDSLREYTRNVLNALEEQGTPAAMVQVGNEINHGLLWPDGHISQLEQLSELLIAGVNGIRDVDPEIPVMMHVALGGQNEESVFWFDNMIARGVEFDIIGISYYPRWHGTLDDLKSNLNDLVNRYHKPVNVVEYSAYKKEVHDIVFSLPDDMGKGTCIWEPLGRRGGMFDSEGELTDMILVYDKLKDEYLNSKK